MRYLAAQEAGSKVMQDKFGASRWLRKMPSQRRSVGSTNINRDGKHPRWIQICRTGKALVQPETGRLHRLRNREQAPFARSGHY